MASRVDGLQDSVARCKSDCTKMHTLFSDLHSNLREKASREDSRAESKRVDSSLQDLREQLRSVGERLSKCERHAGGSGDARTGTDIVIDRKARERISKECGDITRVVKLLATKMTEKDEVARKEIERASLGIERMRDATKRLTEIITRTREETSENSKMVERAVKIATDRLTQEFTGMKKVVQDSIDEIKLRLERQGVPETAKAPGTVSSTKELLKNVAPLDTDRLVGRYDAPSLSL